MPRGIKTCPKCKATTGPRAFNCPKCQFAFFMKNGDPKTLVVNKGDNQAELKINWKELSRRDVIKVVNGSGPYWLLASGEREPMGYSGIFSVLRITKDGILGIPMRKSKDAGFCHIYMGPKKICPKTGMHLRPHKLRKLNKKEKRIVDK